MVIGLTVTYEFQNIPVSDADTGNGDTEPSNEPLFC